MSPEQRKAFDKQVAKRRGEVIEMVDGRQYMTTDNWETAVVISRSGKVKKLSGVELDRARFLAVSKSSASPNWKPEQ